ncbi:pullulanase [Mycolicibacterium novocastrense]|nr:pullulanase [Mycolicibacterium novocastrense]
MDYCLGDGDGSATIWSATPDLDVDGDGAFEAVGLDFDGDGLLDDAMADLDDDGIADHLVRDHAGAATHFTDDGSGSWAVSVERGLRWFGLDGVERFGGPLVDLDADGQDDSLVDNDGDGLADRALAGETAYVDADADGTWDIKLTDSDGDGRADSAAELS